MEYRLAKKLKDAGFQQEGLGGDLTHIDIYACPPNDAMFAYEPTLEELIKACGEDYEKIERRYARRWLRQQRA